MLVVMVVFMMSMTAVVTVTCADAGDGQRIMVSEVLMWCSLSS